MFHTLLFALHDTPTTARHTLSLHDALPISQQAEPLQKPRADHPVGLNHRGGHPRNILRHDDAVGQFLIMQHGPAARGPPHKSQSPVLQPRKIHFAGCPLKISDGEGGGIPSVKADRRRSLALPSGNENRLIDGHVFGAAPFSGAKQAPLPSRRQCASHSQSLSTSHCSRMSGAAQPRPADFHRSFSHRTVFSTVFSKGVGEYPNSRAALSEE